MFSVSESRGTGNGPIQIRRRDNLFHRVASWRPPASLREALRAGLGVRFLSLRETLSLVLSEPLFSGSSR
jgi:hypothetical protein